MEEGFSAKFGLRLVFFLVSEYGGRPLSGSEKRFEPLTLCVQ